MKRVKKHTIFIPFNILVFMGLALMKDNSVGLTLMLMAVYAVYYLWVFQEE
ncbi:hypothetical protein [Petroclostridium sp. X23]|jgi:hypothetical protein|uniref:hypothetical protein n=1 Tax=Petroclostridium sp. X23 TaxID=3045146 RepID=UPI0024ADA654|nr:hypothetical protein [Petroclostridium sp. X23]WHH60532.1 hypothetical protein QKW49_07435 [Petroclostridium sp. X23]